ncbi:MAG: thioredoxin fold domain-containing protein [Candidatus Cloacimonetes bacterium]|nr:thioredoxin fold domain-containing protein [Candidatus Cloacimonadota bacterium]
MFNKITISILLFAVFVLLSCTQEETDSKFSEIEPVQINEKVQVKTDSNEDPITSPAEKHIQTTFEDEEQTLSEEAKVQVTFIELGSKDCVPCKMMEPILEEVRKEYPDQVHVVFHDVKTKEGYAYAQQYKIRVIPTQIFLDSNGEEYFRHEGFFPKDELVKVLQNQGVQ